MTHICLSKLTIIGSDNGRSPGRRQVIIWTNAGILLIRTSGTDVSKIVSETPTFSFTKMHLKVSSAKWRLFRLGLNVLIIIWMIPTSTFSSCCVWNNLGHKISLNFNHLSKLIWHRQLKSFHVEKKDSFIMNSQWHGCGCPVDIRVHRINSYGTDLISFNHNSVLESEVLQETHYQAKDMLRYTLNLVSRMIWCYIL